MKKSLRCECADNPGGRRDVLMLLAALGVTSESVLAQDATKIEPRSYRVLFENAKVRVLEYVARPGIGVCGTGRHSHPDHVTVTLTPARVKITGMDGRAKVLDIPAGSAFWDPATTHTAENIGGSGSRMVLIEIKDRDWQPSSG